MHAARIQKWLQNHPQPGSQLGRYFSLAFSNSSSRSSIVCFKPLISSVDLSLSLFNKIPNSSFISSTTGLNLRLISSNILFFSSLDTFLIFLTVHGPPGKSPPAYKVGKFMGTNVSSIFLTLTGIVVVTARVAVL